MGPCCDDHRQPRMYGRSCASGCTSPVLWHSVCADSCPGVRCGGTLPSSCHSVRADNRARTSSRTHLRPRARPRGCRPRTSGCILERLGTPSSRPSPTTGTFHVAGCVSFRAGAFDAVGDSIPVPGRAGRPRPHRNVPARAGCPQPRHPSAGHPWQPESLVQRVRRHRRRTTTSGPHTRARSDQAGEGAGTPRDARVRQAGAAGPHRSGWLTPIPAARRVRRGPPGAPGYGHRPAPAHCAGGP